MSSTEMSVGSGDFPSAEATLSIYRLYVLDAKNHIRKRVDLECRDDAHAMEVAGEHFPQGGVELWQGARLVKRLERRQT